jgi:hypothetical protein
VSKWVGVAMLVAAVAAMTFGCAQRPSAPVAGSEGKTDQGTAASAARSAPRSLGRERGVPREVEASRLTENLGARRGEHTEEQYADDR